MKETKDRTEQFVHSTSSAAMQPPPTSVLSNAVPTLILMPFLDSLLFNKPRNEDPRYNLRDKGKTRVQDSDLLALDMVSAEEGHATGGLQQLQYMDNQVRIRVAVEAAANILSSKTIYSRVPPLSSP